MKQLLLATVLGLTLPAVAQGSPARPAGNDAAPLRYLPEASAELTHKAFGNPQALQCADTRGPQVVPSSRIVSHDLPAADMTGYLDGPDMSTWFYTMSYQSSTIDHGTWQEQMISGYDITVYNAAFEEVGKVSDTITLQEGEVKVAQVEVGAHITTKFFNTDVTPEMMVVISVNTTEYVNNTYTRVYSIGNNTPLTVIPGYYVSAVNSASDKWSEHFWITFLTEEETETPMVGTVPNSTDMVFKVYKYAGYSGMGDPVLTARVPSITVSGEHAIPFLANVNDGKPWFAVNHMKYCWFENPFDYENENPTPDNELIVDIYTPESSWATTLSKYCTTRIPSEATADDRYFLYVGAFSYKGDLSFGRYTQGDEPSLIVTRETHISASDSYTYGYGVYSTAAQGADAQGSPILSLAHDVASGYFMTDIPGYDPQVMFVRPENDSYKFDFTSLITGQVEQTLPVYISENVSMSESTDRVPGGDSYLYVSAATLGHSDDNGDVFTDVAYITRDGKVDHVDSLNMGPNIDLAQVYVASDAFDPYTFNLDDNREYMVLVKRRDGDTGNHEELLVISSDPEKGTIFTCGPDDEKGALVSIFFANLGTETPRLAVIYGKDYSYTTVAYELPLTLFEAGQGTAEDPYQISSVGGLLQMKTSPDAYYVLTADINGTGASYNIPEWQFGGNLDGRNHVIRDLCISGRGLIPVLMGTATDQTSESTKGVVANLVLVDPVFEATADSQGLLVGQSRYGSVRNVHVHNATMTGATGLGGIVGIAYLNSTISGCSVEGTLTSDEQAGGIVAMTNTNSAVKSCAFSGTIKGESEVGGIVGCIASNGGDVTDCHVNADITAHNTVGGIAGSNEARSIISNCHVQGTITATEAPIWGGGPKAGGITGSLNGLYGSEDDPSAEPVPVILNNYVNLSSISFTGEKGQEAYAGQNDTMHRVVGSSCANDEPEIIDYDDDWNPVYSDQPAAPEECLKDNYVSSALAIVNAAIADDAATTEGKSIQESELSQAWFEGRGFKFGTDIDNPWNGDAFYGKAPRLWFETGILETDIDEITVKPGESFVVYVSLHGRDITPEMWNNMNVTIDNKDVVETMSTDLTSGQLLFGYEARKPGQAVITYNVNGATAQVKVTVLDLSGIDAPESTGDNGIRYQGNMVSAAGEITVFSTSGAVVARGNDSVNIASLPAGVYIVTANGKSLKIRR